MNFEVIVTCAVTGAGETVDKSPHVPVTPKEVADAAIEAAALLPNGENAHVTVRSPAWWRGIVDSIAINYEDVKVMLMCSQTFSSGIIFETFKSSDWLNAGTFETKSEFFTFKQD